MMGLLFTPIIIINTPTLSPRFIMENLFKTKYTQADIDEIKTWFDRHADQLPTEFVLNESTRYLNLPTSIKSFFEIWNIHHDNPTFSGQIYQLFLIRQKLIADGMTD